MSFLSPKVSSPSLRSAAIPVPSFSCPSRLLGLNAQETAQLESETFVQQQKVALTSELKAVLDSWVRFEQQARESERVDLTQTVVDKVLASIKDDKTQKEILASAIAEVERAWFYRFQLLSRMIDLFYVYLYLCTELVKNKAI